MINFALYQERSDFVFGCQNEPFQNVVITTEENGKDKNKALL